MKSYSLDKWVLILRDGEKKRNREKVIDPPSIKEL
jgi:hypothetical protein